MSTKKEDILCYHCGDLCIDNKIVADDKLFCCNGCKTVYEIFSENDLTCYYDIQSNPGSTPSEISGKYDFLANEEIAKKLLEFNDGKHQIISLYIPTIHCSSCIWVLENLNKLQPAVTASQVNFPKKTVRITFKSEEISLKELVLILSSIGYEPYISLEDYTSGKKAVDRQLIYKLGVAGFAFGNTMFLSFPEYFQVDGFWIEKYKYIFRWLMFAFSLPVVFYSGWDYFVSAFKGLRSKVLNIDVPIALGISALFLRSVSEIVLDIGTGFFDSLTGLIFFLLIGRFFQQRTYSFLSFERDYKSYFPIAVTRIDKNKKEETVQVYEIEQGDRLLIRNGELIPVDGVLIYGNALIDYSFVTGEAEAVQKISGDKLFAGGKQQSGVIEIEALKSVEQSYLTQLWSNDVFQKDKVAAFQSLIDRISQRFTIVVLLIAFISTAFWLYHDPSKALNVFTAVLIIACPCAIALASPFTLGNMLRIFGQQKFYFKNANVIERMANISTIIFDKTGTITSNKKAEISYEGKELFKEEGVLLYNILRASNHPLSRQLYDSLSEEKIIKFDSFEEITGKGMKAKFNEKTIKVGSASFVNYEENNNTFQTSVYLQIEEEYIGKYVFQNTYRKGLDAVFESLGEFSKLAILSGDNKGEKIRLEKLLPKGTTLLFQQDPQQKLEFVKQLQQKGERVMMIGDGLNDAGALAQSDVGIVVSENINVFSPACDGILDATQFSEFPSYVSASKKSIKIIKWSFVFSFLYNITGLYFAVSGNLMPVIAAILMPLSSISIVIFTTIATTYVGKMLKKT
ncbi:MAG: heavy metal translocating P-type ATPase metal-binding domain-containing protein [Flavobacteriaceae bacterium]|nr:heavy metal translocating P-type ATPase metal-binding domain-containing protein [Flavobacteriaceae bacterium]